MYFKCFILICALSISYSMMAGGWREVSHDNPDIQKHAKYAGEKISASMNSLYHMKVTNISNVKQQVVSGMRYNMTITLSQTECKKNHNLTKDDIENCPVLPCRAPESCNVILWVRAWLGDEGTKLTKSSCKALPLPENC